MLHARTVAAVPVYLLAAVLSMVLLGFVATTESVLHFVGISIGSASEVRYDTCWPFWSGSRSSRRRTEPIFETGTVA